MSDGETPEVSNVRPQLCIRGGGFLRPGEPQPPLPKMVNGSDDPGGVMEQVPEVDYSTYNDTQVMKPVEQVKAGLQVIVDEARGYAAEILKAEDVLKKAKEKYRAVMENVLPKALREAGFGEVGFPAADGTIVKVKAKVDNSVPAARRNEAWDWLEANNCGDILKREVTIPFLVKEGEDAKKLREEMEKRFMRTVICERRAEPATLKATLVKLMENQKKMQGAPVVPRDLFGIREYDIAEFKAPKTKAE